MLRVIRQIWAEVALRPKILDSSQGSPHTPHRALRGSEALTKENANRR